MHSWRSNKYQFYNLWFDPIGVGTQDLPHSRQALPLQDFKYKLYIYLCFSPFWNFDIPTNAVLYERSACILPPPHPEMESLRAQLTAKLRQHYQELCHSREGNNSQTWGQLHSNVIDYITITLQFS